MSNIIPPLLSSTPPPIGNIEDEDDDFGDFTAADYSFSCEAFSIPSTPHDTPKKAASVISSVDINSNSSHINRLTEKDHQDKRKDLDTPALPDFSVVPSDLGTLKDQNVPLPSLKTDDFYREEPPEIFDDAEDDFGDFEYNPSLSVDQEDEETNIEIPEVVDFTCSEFIDDINELDHKIKEFNEINSVKSKCPIQDEKSEMNLKNIINEEKCEITMKSKNVIINKSESSDINDEIKSSSKSESVETSKEPVNDDDFGDFEFQSATDFNETTGQESNNSISEKPNAEERKIDVSMYKSNKINSCNNVNAGDSNFKQSDSELTCNKLDLDGRNVDFKSDPNISDSDPSKISLNPGTTSVVQSNSNNVDLNCENATEFFIKTADDSNFSLNSDDETVNALVNNFKPDNINSAGDQHIPNEYSANTNFTMIDDHTSDLCDDSMKDDDHFQSSDEKKYNEFEIEENHHNGTELIHSKIVTITNENNAVETVINNSEKSGCNIDENTSKYSGKLDHSDFDDDFSDFADFRTLENTAPINKTTESVNEKTNSDDNTLAKNQSTDDVEFGDFAASNVFETDFKAIETNEADDDEFGEFDDYTSSATTPVMLAMNSKNVGDEAKAIFEVMFPAGQETENEDFHSFDFIAVDGVFKEMKDITDTNALSYQWGKSRTQKELLKSLNIDTRNILYGHGLNPMPKFAANLGLTPLEPVKSEILTPTPVSIPSTTSSQSNPPVMNADIPTAQFDWSESGLANPLDSVTKEEEVQNQENTTNTNNATPVTPRKSFDNESVNSLQFAEIPNDAEDQKSPEDDFSDFTSFKSNPGNNLANMVPLRESYINNAEIKNSATDEPGWLKPTILTPVMVRKYEPEVDDEDEFTDFQRSLPPTTGLTVLPVQNEEINKSRLNAMEVNILKPNTICNSAPIIEKEVEPKVVPSFTDLTLLSNEGTNVSKESTLHNVEVNIQKSIPHSAGLNKFQEETDILKSKKNDGINLKPIQNQEATVINNLNPMQIYLKKDAVDLLQPVQKDEANILQPVQVFKPVEEAVINWPDPGITEEELARFEMYSKTNNIPEKKDKMSVERKMSGNTGLMLVEKSVVVPANKVVLPSKEVLLPPNDKVVISKDLVLPILESSPRKYTPLKNQRETKEEEDDWTDFISIKPVQNLQNERTATPELPLSIPQLSHIQPPKLPIPVITPQGLVQTKIPSAPTAQTKNPQAVLHLNPPQDGYQPAIISHQYQMQMNQNVFSGVLQNASYQTTSIPANIRTTPTHQANANGIKSSSSSFDDSEEWTDFVSSRPTANGLATSQSQSIKLNTPQSIKPNLTSAIPKPNYKTPQFNNWNTPLSSSNLYMTSNSYQNHNFPNFSTTHPNGLNVNTNKNIPSISALPELDFVTSKNRTYSKK